MKWKAEHAGTRCLTAGTSNCNGHHPPHLHSLHTDMYLLKVNFCKTSNTDTLKYIPDIQSTGLRYLLSMAAASGWRPMTDSECNDGASLHWGSTIQSWIDDEDWRCRLEYLVSLPYNDGHITSPSPTPRPPLLRWTPCLVWSPGRPTPGLIAHYNWFFRPNLGDVVVTLILIWWVVNL